jgi:hypothetical protein
VRIGALVSFRVRAVADVFPAPLALHHVTAGTVHLLYDDRVVLGSGATIDIPGAPARAAVLMLHANGEIWLDGPETSRELALGEPFVVAGHDFRVEQASSSANETWPDRDQARYPYTLQARIDGPGGAVASLTDPDRASCHNIGAENRATLLYVLGRRRRSDLAAGLRGNEAGWIDDEEAMVSVWGRCALRQASSNYSVLIHRIRREVETAGFDAGFLEKRRGAARVRLDRFELG